MVLRAAHYAKKLKQFSPKASLCKSTFLSFDSENKILILNISWKRKITFLNFTWYTHFAFASNFTFESNFAMLSNFAISNARHMPFARHMPSARRTTSARHMPFHVICHLLVLLLIKNDLRAKRYKWIIICREIKMILRCTEFFGVRCAKRTPQRQNNSKLAKGLDLMQIK